MVVTCLHNVDLALCALCIHIISLSHAMRMRSTGEEDLCPPVVGSDLRGSKSLGHLWDVISQQNQIREGAPPA